MIAEAVNWQNLGQNTLLFIVGLIGAWNTYQGSKRAKTLDQIHTLTNSNMGAQKKMLAEVTAAKAAITHDAKDLEAAGVALNDYLDHEKKQAQVDAQPK